MSTSSQTSPTVTPEATKKEETTTRKEIDPKTTLPNLNDLDEDATPVQKKTKKSDKNKKSKKDTASVSNPATSSSSDDEEEEHKMVTTKTVDWSLNVDDESKKRFWWNKTYSISLWENNMELEVDGKLATTDEQIANATDVDVWRGFTKYQISAVYKLCPICKMPEQNEDCKICCYCSGVVHKECCVKAEHENIIWKPSNKGMEKYMAICFDCEDLKDQPKRPYTMEPDNARRACIRALASGKEYPPAIRMKLTILRDELNEVYGEDGSKSKTVSKETNAAYLDQVQSLVALYFQPGNSSSYTTKKPIESKCGGLGVVAVKDIPRFTIVGVYPGYEDPLSGEHAKLDRPGPKYSLVDLNCADYHNNVFTEHAKTVTPFINEPNVGELSNVAWIQETCKPEGRLSVMTVRDIKADEELLIGYGPLYPRTYPYTYDAYAYHLVEGRDDFCFALWHWKSLDEKDADFVCYCGYDPETDVYKYWETEDEMKERKRKEAAAAKEKAAALAGSLTAGGIPDVVKKAETQQPSTTASNKSDKNSSVDITSTVE